MNNEKIPTAYELYEKHECNGRDEIIDAIEEALEFRHKYYLKLDNLMKENERLENIISGYTSSLKDYDVERKHLINENQKLREALVKIRRWDDELEEEYGDPGELAKEALKGLGQ